MAGFPVESEPSGQFHYSSDHEEPMDTDSEADYESQAGSPVDGGHGPEDILSTRMDISDTEDPIHEKTGKRPLPPPSIRLTNNANSLKEIGDHRLVNGLANHVPLQGEIDRIVQNNTSVTRVDRDRTASLDNIKDLEQSMHSISVPLWQKILSFIPPTSLGKILRTSHLFHALLNPQGPQEIAFQMFFHGKSGFIPSEAIWQASRTRFAPGIPKPLKSKSELEMWQLIRGQTCQVCQQAKAFINAQDITNPWSSGPGDNGVRIVWLCGIRICGICLTQRCQQEVSLQLSGTFPSFLIEALPPLFLTQFNDWISEATLSSQPAPPHLQIRKFYYQTHVDLILNQFREVKDLGEAASEEWLKGLDLQRQERLHDANRWEQWEQNGGLRNFMTNRTQKTPPAAMGSIGKQSSLPFLGNNGMPVPTVPTYVDEGIPTYHFQGPPPMPMIPPMLHMPFQGYPPPPYGNFHPPSAPFNPQIMQGKPRRSLQEVNEARAARRQEIERRCLELDPPIIPKLLSHMQSFQAALQISFPFTDKDWDVLKPRLLAQREGAETREADFAEQLKVIQTTAVQSTLEMLLMRDPNELAENEWEQVQAPVRELLAKYAEEYINEKWEDGSHVDQDNVLHFAPDVLLNIRVKYYETLNQPNPTGGPSHSRIPLSLESMKWLYDNKVKNIAESYQKELFQCNTCDSSSRFYGFEGIIQHYAAKHTTALSLGNIVVNWRTEWPDVPPFNPSPGSGTNGRNGSSANPNDQAASVLTHGEYGPPHQVQQHPIQPGGQYSFNYASYHQEPPAYGQAENMSHREVPGGRPLVPHGFAIPNPYVPTPVVDEAFSTSQLPYTSVSASSDLHRRQLTEMAQYSRDLWNATMGIKEMPASVRIYVLIHHMSAKFEKKFGTVPDISMFQHGLNENAQMRPVRSLNGLSCKACNQNAHTTSTERKLFTLPALVNHFKLTHQEQAYASSDVVQSDWRVDMVALPESPVIESLVDSNGMDDRKFALIAEPFTDVFPLPLPILSHFKESRAKEKAARIRLQNLQSLDIVPPGNAHHQRHPATTNRSSKTNSSRVSVERLPSRSPLESDIGTNEPPREDEYDPSRPLFIGDIVEHTGRRRSAGLQTTANIVLPPGIISLGVVDSHGQPENTRTQGGYDDRLLRHHRRLVRRPTEYETPRQEVYPVHQSLNPSSVAVNVATDVVAVDRFLNDLSPTAPTQHNRNAYISNTYSSVRDMNPRRFDDHSVQPLTRESIHTYSPPRYAEPLSSYQDSVPVQDQRYISQSYIDPVYYSGVPPPERRWEPHPSHQAQVSHAFAGRDRSRSPRRSVTREYIGYDPNVPQHPYQERHDVRWRGESPPRGEIYRGHNENSYGERSGDSFVGRDAQGRNVRYIAVPVDEYESQTERHHHPVRAPLPESIQYIGRSSTLMENGAGERFYMVDNRGPLRHNVDPAEDRYREYR